LSPEEADRLVGALRTHRDQAMVLGMLLAGLRRCEVGERAPAHERPSPGWHAEAEWAQIAAAAPQVAEASAGRGLCASGKCAARSGKA
jgi:hypothetical protein